MQQKTASHSSPQSPQQRKKQEHTSISSKKPQKNKGNDAQPFEIRLINPEGKQNEQTLNKLLDMNQNYLLDKIKISDVPKPSKYAHKIPSKTGNSEYNQKYSSLMKPIAVGESTPQRDKTGSIMKLPNHPVIEYASTYHNDYTSKKQEVSDNPHKIIKKYTKQQAPRFIESSYHRDYQSVAPSPVQSAKRTEVKLMGGGKLASDTTYKQCFRLKTNDASDISHPIVHKDNKIFITMENPQQSSYQQTFNSKPKKIKVQMSCKPSQKYSPNSNKMKYKTQYNDVYVGQLISQKKQFQCLTKQQLKKYVMTILKE